ncbi:ALG6, ALG8 glycosyltransferase [Meredithblackwellia eburnea MCA 4105]
MGKNGFENKSVWGSVLVGAVLVKLVIGLGGYSGEATPPLRGDFEAQRHWLSLTTSSLSHPSLHPPIPAQSIPVQKWYYHDLPYWGLDYPPLTAYHSLLLGTLLQWMKGMEKEGWMKDVMRWTVVGGDVGVYVSAVVVWCRSNFGGKSLKGRGRREREAAVALASILLQPSLILIDNGHFQYNSLMLGLTLWSINLFQAGRDLSGSVLFVAALGFKQMALYYSPAVFAYLLGKCFYLGGRPGIKLFLQLGIVVLTSFVVLFSPFLSPPTVLLQSLHRIFPFSRGLFEDKVANAWCVINVVVKLRDIASIAVLARVALLATVVAVLPSVVGVVWVSWGLPPTIALLPHALFISGMAFFLFSFQVHEKSILLPLMPLTLLMGAREAGWGRLDWEWSVLLNNVGVFSMWPLLRRDGLGLQYLVLTFLWNYLIGYNPLRLRNSFVKGLSLLTYLLAFLLHTLELLTSPPSHLPDLFVVFNVTLSAGVFGLGFLWASKRLVQEGWAAVGSARL